MRKNVVLIILILSFPDVIFGEIIRVPEDQPTLQSGIDAANYGDTVLIADGLYTGPGNKNLDYKTKDITVISENGPLACIIDCENSGRAFYFHSHEGMFSILKGFTIKSGGGSNGGGINCTGSSPTISECILIDNSAAIGGGIFLNRANAIISNCKIQNNEANYGAAIYIWNANPLLINNVVIDNVSGSQGGACYLKNSGPTIGSCTFVGNSAVSGGALYAEKKYYPTTNIINSIFWENQANLGPEMALNSSANVMVSYSDVEGGSAGVYIYSGSGAELHWLEGNMDENPLFVTGPNGGYYLSSESAGQPSDSPCIDAGSEQAEEVCFTNLGEITCLDRFTTASNELPDEGTADLGFHYNIDIPLPSPTPEPTLTFTVAPTATHTLMPTYTVQPTLTLTPTPSPCISLTPIPTITPGIPELGVRLEMPSRHFQMGDECYLNANIFNYVSPLEAVPFFVVLDIYSHFWFWDDWTYLTDQVDFVYINVPLGETSINIIPSFTWPDTGAVEIKGVLFWAAITRPDFSDIYGGPEGIGRWKFSFR